MSLLTIVDSSPPSPNDPNLTNGDPSDDELDYALLRLVRDIGNEPAGSGNNPDAPVRSWTQLAANSLNINDPILVLQHPQNPVSWKLEPLKLTMGRALDLVGGGRRLRHDANTLPGSSGSPCFSVTLAFVALHHAGGRLPIRQGRLQSGHTLPENHRSPDAPGHRTVLEGCAPAMMSAQDRLNSKNSRLRECGDRCALYPLRTMPC